MAKTVYKVDLSQALVHALPIGADALHADYQEGAICVWFLVDDARRKMNYAFLVAGTGWQLPDYIQPSQHIASVRNPDNRNCWHIFNLGYLEDMKPFDRRSYEMIQPQDAFKPEDDVDGAS